VIGYAREAMGRRCTSRVDIEGAALIVFVVVDA
jgi:hypothetical protein